jgi:hypothetical protein
MRVYLIVLPALAALTVLMAGRDVALIVALGTMGIAFPFQTVRKSPEFGVKQREERAVREFGPFGPHRPPDAT